MTGSVFLAAYAGAAGFAAPVVLRRAWAQRAPRLATSLWLALSVSWVMAVALAILGMLAPFPLSWTGPASSDGPALLAGHAGLGGAAVTTAGLLLAVAVVLRAGTCVATGLAHGGHQRHEHAAFLAAAGRADHALGATVLDHVAPVAYCLPSGRHRVVVSTAALAVLRPGPLRAVLAHERAHLHGHHHMILTVATGLARAFPRVPLLAHAGAEVPVLTEMAADDAAVRRHDPADLAAALVILARTGARAAALTAGGPAAMIRIERLLAPPPRPGRPGRTASLAAGAAALALPVAVACLPFIALACDVAGRP